MGWHHSGTLNDFRASSARVNSRGVVIGVADEDLLEDTRMARLRKMHRSAFSRVPLTEVDALDQ